MNDKKEKLPNGAPQDDYHEEMEELARIFKEELDKAVSDAEDANRFDDLEKVEVEGYDPKSVSLDKDKSVEGRGEDELCECCGERPRGTKKHPDSAFCEECEAVLEKYPYDWKGILTAILVVGVMIYSFVMLMMESPAFANSIRGDRALKDGKVFTAIYKYETAFSHIDSEYAKEYKGLFAKHVIAEYRANALSDVWAETEEFFTETDLKMPWFKDVKEAYDDANLLSISMSAVENIHLADYSSAETSSTEKITEDYDRIVGILDGLSGKKIYEKNGEYHDETETDFTPDGTETVYVYDETILNLYKYSAAITADKDYDVIAGFLEKVNGGSLCMSDFAKTNLAVSYVHLGKFDEAEKLAEELRENNCEANNYYYVMSMIYRIRDKDYTKAVDICLEGLNMLAKLDEAYELVAVEGRHLSMQKTLALIMAGKYTEAYESAGECFDYDSYYQSEVLGYSSAAEEVSDMYIILAIHTGDEDVYNEYAEQVVAAGEDAVVHEHVSLFKEGKITLTEIVNSGRYDWQ